LLLKTSWPAGLAGTLNQKSFKRCGLVTHKSFEVEPYISTKKPVSITTMENTSLLNIKLATGGF
jgi:hypothetical protein